MKIVIYRKEIRKFPVDASMPETSVENVLNNMSIREADIV